MQFLSIDIETTGLNPDTCQVIEVAAVVADLSDRSVADLPYFHCYINHPIIQGEPFALAMNAEILRILAKGRDQLRLQDHLILSASEFWPAFGQFLSTHHLDGGRLTVAGKNFAGFDREFLARLADRRHIELFHHRVLDPGMLFWLGNEVPPNMQQCMDRAGIVGNVAHQALEDARVVVELIRRGTRRFPFTAEPWQ